MAVKLGEMLVKGGVITIDQLEEALKYQVIFGGKLGTNLIELDFIDEEGLAWFLSEKLGVPYVHPEKLMEILPDVIRIVPEHIVRKYRVIPLSVEKKRLTLVMSDPSDLSAIDEISFITGMTIKPVVTPEVRLILALEKYYHVERDARYIPIIERKGQKPKKPETAPEKPAATPDEWLAGPEEEPTAKAEATPSPRKAAEEIIDLEDEFEEAELLEEEARREMLAEFTIDDVSKELAAAEAREEIADAMIGFAGNAFNHAALFIVRGKMAVGWRASREKEQIDISKLQIDLKEPSVLKTVSEGKSYYLGPLPDTKGNTKLLEPLGGQRPSAALLIPVMMMGKVVNILYVDGGETDISEEVIDMQRMAGKASMAFEILILRHKIMLT